MTLSFRRGTLADSFTVYHIFYKTLAALWQSKDASQPAQNISEEDEAAAIEARWQIRRSIFEHLARTCEHFWLAEIDGQAVGYARSILRDQTRELTEFFVLPDHQTSGIGRGLLERAFPVEGADHRTIIATLDTRAQGLYLRTGVFPCFPGCNFELPENVNPAPVATDLEFQPIDAASLDILRPIDQAIIGHTRDVDHAWLMQDRSGFIYYRGGTPVGYGYSGSLTGPFALLDDADYPAVISHAQQMAHAAGDEFFLEVPLINRAAVTYLLANGYRMDTGYEFFMSNEPYGKFENYIFLTPPILF